MNSPHLGLPAEEFSKAFPFHLVFNENAEIIQAGEVLQRISPEPLIGTKFEQHYQICRPKIPFEFAAIRKQCRSLFLLQSLHNGMQLKGQMMYVEELNVIFFLGSIWVTDTAALRPLGVALKDFAIHDPIVDFLFMLQAQSTALADAKKLTDELTKQREALKLKIEQIQRLQSENMRLSAELEITRQLQQMILPKQQELEQVSGLEISGFMEPAQEVGGDYYDVLTKDNQVKVCIGDVTGHGLESGVLMIIVQTAVRTLLTNNETDPVRFLDALNRTIYDNLQRMNSDKTLTLSLLDYQDGVISLSGQHEEMIVVRTGGKVERIDTIDLGFPIGLDTDIADFISQIQVKLDSGDVVVLYTDGITEAENNLQKQYGLDRLCEVVSRNWNRSTDEIKQAVIADVREHIGEQKVYDDITLLVLKQK